MSYPTRVCGRRTNHQGGGQSAQPNPEAFPRHHHLANMNRIVAQHENKFLISFLGGHSMYPMQARQR
jgi:hypothetical protein